MSQGRTSLADAEKRWAEDQPIQCKRLQPHVRQPHELDESSWRGKRDVNDELLVDISSNGHVLPSVSNCSWTKLPWSLLSARRMSDCLNVRTWLQPG
jgi:hypothetical protein